ncbi:MAG: Rnf-Nqr domain containing protein [Pseudohongiellaceae bacterium]
MSDLEIQAERSGLIWENNSVFVQLLGLSPVLAVSSTAAYGLGLGLATLLVCVCSCLTTSAVRKFISHKWRLIWFMVILASYTTLVETICQIYFYPLSLRLGIYLPLICCNVAILLRMETVASRTNWIAASIDAIKAGLGFLLAIVFVSILRELLIAGSVFSNWQMLLPSNGMSALPSQSESAYFFQFANTQAGAFILIGLLIALINFISSLTPHPPDQGRDTIVPVQRARVTGRLITDESRE